MTMHKYLTAEVALHGQTSLVSAVQELETQMAEPMTILVQGRKLSGLFVFL